MHQKPTLRSVLRCNSRVESTCGMSWSESKAATLGTENSTVDSYRRMKSVYSRPESILKRRMPRWLFKSAIFQPIESQYHWIAVAKLAPEKRLSKDMAERFGA